jgi:metallo-beta-lactamase class B
MSASRRALLAGLLPLAASCAPAPQPLDLPPGPPADEFLAQCEGKDGWNDPAPPVRLFGNVYQVGTCGITALLVASNQGHILLDAGTAEAAPLVVANIRELGFAIEDVEWIVTSHEHHDHVGGVAELQAMTGARVAASAAARRQLETGILDPADPQAGLHDPFPAIRIDRVMRDGEMLHVGPLTLTLHETPGHALGSTSWSWRSCAGAECRRVAYADSVTAVSRDDYRFSDHPDYVAMFRRGMNAMAAIDCDLLLTPHPGASALHQRLAGERPLAAQGACRDYAQTGRANLDARLAREATGQ